MNYCLEFMILPVLARFCRLANERLVTKKGAAFKRSQDRKA